MFDGLLSPRKRSAFPAANSVPTVPAEPVMEVVNIEMSGRGFPAPAPEPESPTPQVVSPNRMRSPFKAEAEPPVQVEPELTTRVGEQALAAEEEAQQPTPEAEEAEEAASDGPCDCGECDASEGPSAATEPAAEPAAPAEAAPAPAPAPAAAPLSPASAAKENRNVSARNIPNLPNQVYVKRFGSDRVFHADRKCKRFMQKKGKESAIKHHLTPCGKCASHLLPGKAPAPVTSPVRKPLL